MIDISARNVAFVGRSFVTEHDVRAIGKIRHNYASESEAGRKRNMAIVETLFVELEQFFIECKIKIDGAAKRIAGEFNAIDSGAVFWINTAIILETDILVVHRLERFECDNTIFATANRNKVAMKIVANAKFWFFSRCVCYDFEKIIVCDI